MCNSYIKKIGHLEESRTLSIPKDNFEAVKTLLSAMEHHFVQLAESDTVKKQNDVLNKS